MNLLFIELNISVNLLNKLVIESNIFWIELVFLTAWLYAVFLRA